MFMSPAMSIAAFLPTPLSGLVITNVASSFIEEVGNITGMSYPESILMDPIAFYFYSEAMLIAEINLGVSRADMADFAEWHGPW